MGDSRELRRNIRGRRGSNIIEFSMLFPWYVFLFVGAYDWGFFGYSLIATQSAARAGANYCATQTTLNDAATACTYVLNQLRDLPNVGSSLTTCGTGSTVTTAAPVSVIASSVSGPDGNSATAVTVIYQTPQLVPIPGLLPGILTIHRTVTMRQRN
jgi:Flp pilus assembly protein TadG